MERRTEAPTPERAAAGREVVREDLREDLREALPAELRAKREPPEPQAVAGAPGAATTVFPAPATNA